MKCEDYDSSLISLVNAPYSSTLATPASASSGSVWSVASSQSSDSCQSSQSSDNTSVTAPLSECDPDESQYRAQQTKPYAHPSQSQSSCDPSAPKLAEPWHRAAHPAPPPLRLSVHPPELRQNPRRTSASSTTRTGCPPALVRQVDRKVNFVENLVENSTQIVEAIWPTSSVVCRSESGNGSVLPLRTFIQETLRRSRTSYSTLQVALYYLILVKSHVPDHDFTMEQPRDCHASRALQCGRRMFLAALILASKYLQDRNYSARAWSKISGLATQEINQNEIAFLLAVNWKLHITDVVYNRWTDCVMKFYPPPPPPPSTAGLPAQFMWERQCGEFRNFILRLTPELDNLEDLRPCTPVSSPFQDSPLFPRAWLPCNPAKPANRSWADRADGKETSAPSVLEPNVAPACGPLRRRSSMLSMLPTPGLTPQSCGFNTPAVSAVPQLLGRGSSMGYAMAQASTVCATQALDRWPGSAAAAAAAAAAAPSPVGYIPTRRSSLANSVSTASSPESMISDASRTSRSSSISSASSLVSAPTSSKLDVQARGRFPKLSCERLSLRHLTIASVPEDYEYKDVPSSLSPETYAGPVGKSMRDLALPFPSEQRGSEMDAAARALQELQNHQNWQQEATPTPRAAMKPRALQELQNHQNWQQVAPTPRVGMKRPSDSDLQDSVRSMLRDGAAGDESSWPEKLVRPGPATAAFSARRPWQADSPQVSVSTSVPGSGKRLCCSSEVMQRLDQLHPSMLSMGGPGMWRGIL